MTFKKSFQNLSILGAGQLTVIIFNVIFYFGLAYFLVPEQYGQLAYLISIATIVPTFTRFGLSQSVIIFSAKKEYQIKKRANLLGFISAIVTSGFLFLIDPFVAILSFSFSIFMMQVGNYLGEKQYKAASLSQVGKSVVWVLVAIPLFFVMGISGVLLGMMIGNIIFSINYLKNLTFNEWSLGIFKKKFKSILNNFSVDVSQIIPNQIDKLIIVPLFGFQLTGIFHFAIQILMGIELLTIVLHRFLLAEQSSEKITKRFFYIISFLSTIIILAGIFISPYIIENIFPEYLESIFAIQLIVFGIIPLLTISILNAKLQVLESNLVGYGVIVRIGTNLVLIPILGGLMGIIGLVLSNLISIILLSIYLVIIYNKIRNSRNLIDNNSH